MKKIESPTTHAGVSSMKGTAKAFKAIDKHAEKAGYAAKKEPKEDPEKKKIRLELQKRYDDECRKLNAARALPEWAKSIEAIRLCGENISAIKKEAREAEVVIEIASDESFGTDKPGIHITKEGRAIFVCGDVRFETDISNLNRVVGANGEDTPLDKLMDSQLLEIARSIGLQTEPFARSLIMSPLKGMLQMVWYRDVEHHQSGHLEENQHRRIEEYHRALQRYSPDEQTDSENGAVRTRKTRTASKVTIPVDQHKKLLELHKKGQSTGAIAIALGMERSKASRAAIRNAIRSLSGQKA